MVTSTNLLAPGIVRYRPDEIVDGTLIRKQHSEKKDAAERLCAEFMATINAQVPGKCGIKGPACNMQQIPTALRAG